MRAILPIFAAALLSAGCSGAQAPATDTSPGDAVAEEEKPVQTSREQGPEAVLRAFLTARWALDEDATLPLVTRGDRENVWPFAFEPAAKKQFADGQKPESLYEWDIVSVQQDGEMATAVVEVLIPTAMEFNAWKVALRDAIAPDPWSYDEVEAARARAKSLLRVTVPPRTVVPMTYRMVREDDAWRVHMGWKHFPKPTPTPERALASAQDFEGSEKWWIEAIRAPAMPVEKQKFYRALRQAEAYVARRLYGEAIQAYSKLEPVYEAELVADRIRALREGEKWWADTLEGANLSIQPRYRSTDGKTVLKVSVANRGSSDLREIRFEVWTRHRERPSSSGSIWSTDFRIARLDAGEETTLILGSEPTANAKGPVPEDLTKAEIEKVNVRRLTFVDSPQNPPYTSSDEFEKQVLIALTGGEWERTAWRIHQEIMKTREERLKCSGWPDKPFQAQIHVDELGSIAGVVLSEGSPEFAACVKASLLSVKLAEGEPVTVAIDLLPPSFIEADAAK